MAEDRCVACGAIIPEGRYLCPNCENGGTCGSIIVSFDCTNGVDKSLMLVGRKEPKKPVDVINAITGKEAESLWKRLITKKEAK
jgi:hypothetical protein